MSTVKEILDEFKKHEPRFYGIRVASGWVVKDNRSDMTICRSTDGDKIARLLKLLNGAEDVNS